jgi:hypothetical protein
MNQPNPADEPWKNVELESAMIGLRMTLTPEETAEAREKFLNLLRISPLAVPTLQPAPTGPDGALLPNAPINLLVVNTAEGVSGVPAFTSVAGLRANLPDIQNGMPMSGADLGVILGDSGHKLFVTSPDMHVEVETQELKHLALLAQQQIVEQQQAVQNNQALTAALAALGSEDNGANREAVIRAFLDGYCRYPVLSEADGDAEALVLSQDAPQGDVPAPELALLTVEGALPAFSSEEAIRLWDPAGRNAIALPGQMVVQLATQAEVPMILLDAKGPHPYTMNVRQGQLTLT